MSAPCGYAGSAPKSTPLLTDRPSGCVIVFTSIELAGELDAWLVWHAVRWLFALLGAVAAFWAVSTWGRPSPR